MARINRSDVIQKAVNDLALSQSGEKIPNETLDKVQLTDDLNKKYSSFSVSDTKSTTGILTVILPTIDVRSEIYITSVDIGMIKDVTCDQATGTMTASLVTDSQGIIKTVLQFPMITLTAQSEHAHLDFAYPMKIKPNNNFQLSGTFTAGVMVRTACLTGFIVSTN
jgi:hypothetical protein